MLLIQLTTYNLQLTTYELRVTSYELRVTGYGVRGTGYGLRVNEPEDFAGANAIIFGWCKKSNKDKLYIQVKDKQPCHIFVKMNSDKAL